MRNFLKLIVVFAILTSGAFILATRSTLATSTPADGEKFDSLESPRSLYVQNCARCHGSNGRAQTSLGRKLEADDLTSGESKGLSTAKVIRTITNGHGKMPGFRNKLNAAQISSIAGYIKSL